MKSQRSQEIIVAFFNSLFSSISADTTSLTRSIFASLDSVTEAVTEDVEESKDAEAAFEDWLKGEAAPDAEAAFLAA